MLSEREQELAPKVAKALKVKEADILNISIARGDDGQPHYLVLVREGKSENARRLTTPVAGVGDSKEAKAALEAAAVALEAAKK